MEGSVLGTIVTRRRLRVEQAKAVVPLAEIKAAAEARRDFRSFEAALRGKNPAVIAEMKKASPSHGLLREDYDVGEIAAQYERGGAAALSVLTEEEYFGGSLADLVSARESAGLPVLRKDFIVDEYQLFESAARGADAVLLIVAALPDAQLKELIRLAGLFRLSALVEVHSEGECARALQAGATTIGVNNRDLKTLEVSLETSFRLAALIPASSLKISESGIRTAADLTALYEAGYNAALIGERFMTEPEPGAALAALLDDVKKDLAGRRETTP